MMISPEQSVSNRLPRPEAEQQRLQTLKDLGLLELDSIAVFEEATQTAAHFLDATICILGLLDAKNHYFKAAVGLSRLGLMNQLASNRQLARQDSFAAQVVDRQQVLIIPDTAQNSAVADLSLVQRYGVRAYLGVPLVTSGGDCIGVLEVMELAPREFTTKDIDGLQMMARWCMSEFERDRLLKQSAVQIGDYPRFPQPTNTSADTLSNTALIKASLIAEMTQELSTPLTSILGMGSVLSQGIYGTLTSKQKEYIAIIHTSGQYLMALVNEIVELGGLEDSNAFINLAPVDIEMLCQQAISSLAQLAERRDQTVQLTVEPGPRVWLLDKDKVRQMLYHLVASIIQISTSGGTIRIHVSRRQTDLNITVWSSHPWLSDGLPTDLSTMNDALLNEYMSADADLDEDEYSSDNFHQALPMSGWEDEDFGDLDYAPKTEVADVKPATNSRHQLSLALSRRLAEIHGGSLTTRGSLEEGYQYVIRLPQMKGNS
jgi:signal transduction histidine kinase